MNYFANLFSPLDNKINQFIVFLKKNGILKFCSSFVAVVLVSYIAIIVANIYSYNDLGSADFNNHATVINELKFNLLHPKQPFYGTNESTQYFTPYHVIVAIFCKVFNMYATEALHVFRIINIITFLLIFYLFLKRFYGYFNLLSLGFVILLWGGSWRFSGVIDFTMINVAPYHSLFSTNLILMMFYLLTYDKYWNLFLIPIVAAIAFISQPINLFFIIFGIFAFSIFNRKISTGRLIKIASIYFLFAILIISWPYYSIISVFTRNVQGVSAWPSQIFPMYNINEIIRNSWPILLMIPIIFRKDIIKKNLHLLIIAICLLLVYLILYSKNSELVGRNLIIITFLIQIVLSYAIIEKIAIKSVWILLLIPIFVCFAFNLREAYSQYANRSDKSFLYQMEQEMPIISRHINHYDVVLSDINTGYYLPSYSGKVIATIFSQTLVPSDQERTKDLELFFQLESNNTLRSEIIHKYNAKYLLLNKNFLRTSRYVGVIKMNKDLLNSISFLGEKVIELDQLVLYKTFLN